MSGHAVLAAMAHAAPLYVGQEVDDLAHALAEIDPVEPARAYRVIAGVVNGIAADLDAMTRVAKAIAQQNSLEYFAEVFRRHPLDRDGLRKGALERIEWALDEGIPAGVLVELVEAKNFQWSDIEDTYAGCWDSAEEYGRELLNETEAFGRLPEELEPYIDYGRLAADLMQDMIPIEGSGRLYLWHA